MSLPLSLAARVVRIIPRLASNHDGEVVASARAIDRTLRAAGADWHDFAAAFERGSTPFEAPKVSSVAGYEGPPTWRTLSPDGRESWLNAILAQQGLTPWGKGFMRRSFRNIAGFL